MPHVTCERRGVPTSPLHWLLAAHCSAWLTILSSLGWILLPSEGLNIFFWEKKKTNKQTTKNSYKLLLELIELLSELEKQAVPYTHLIHELA